MGRPPCSRDTPLAAGWACGAVGSYRDLMPADAERFSWVRTAVLWQARRDTQARLLGDPSLRQRRRWIALARSRGADPGLVVDRADLAAPSFAVIGDPGEGDASQYAVVPPLLTVAMPGSSPTALAATLRLRCFAATGCAEHEADPPVEDEVVIALR